ncbi:Sensory transduction histidine kinase [Hyphomicrobium sulfonivorans]|uniref:histidine kinase n=1 Tax=Hyphomicrobium sulfonivorans TaxID=121290 RepID=A0A109BRC0_HYPSL|nr:HWE histidine kinase domain-containing protein [Hyphomicrobium sulfonivorans]KWT72797.1 Sensory transduction histidine kinase [Hyphomicrobium sulfonivorans]
MRPPWSETVAAYASALGFVLIAALFRFGLAQIDPKILIFSTFYPALLASAIMYGRGPGIAAIVLSTVLGLITMQQQSSWLAEIDAARTINLALFLLSGGILVWIGSAYRNSQQKLTAEQERRALLLRELNHRNKNATTVVQSIVSQTLRADPETAAAINGRLGSLFATNDLLTRSETYSASLADILDEELRPFIGHAILLSGPPVPLGQKIAPSLALILHELITNAAKHGALSTPEGRLTVQWEAGDRLLTVHWSEHGGPNIVTAPESTGFGTKLIRGVTAALGGTIDKSWQPSGMKATLVVPYC